MKHRTAETLRRQLEREPTAQEMPQALDVCTAEVRPLGERNQAILSLEKLMAETGRLINLIADHTATNSSGADGLLRRVL